MESKINVRVVLTNTGKRKQSRSVCTRRPRLSSGFIIVFVNYFFKGIIDPVIMSVTSHIKDVCENGLNYFFPHIKWTFKRMNKKKKKERIWNSRSKQVAHPSRLSANRAWYKRPFSSCHHYWHGDMKVECNELRLSRMFQDVGMHHTVHQTRRNDKIKVGWSHEYLRKLYSIELGKKGTVWVNKKTVGICK